MSNNPSSVPDNTAAERMTVSTPTTSPPTPVSPSSPTLLLNKLGKESLETYCAKCEKSVATKVKMQRRPEIVCASIMLCTTGLWCCALSLFWNPEFSTAKHYCPTCEKQITSRSMT